MAKQRPLATATFIDEVSLPTGEYLAVYRAPCGGIFGVDSSFIEQEEPESVTEPFNNEQVRLIND